MLNSGAHMRRNARMMTMMRMRVSMQIWERLWHWSPMTRYYLGLLLGMRLWSVQLSGLLGFNPLLIQISSAWRIRQRRWSLRVIPGSRWAPFSMSDCLSIHILTSCSISRFVDRLVVWVIFIIWVVPLIILVASRLWSSLQEPLLSEGFLSAMLDCCLSWTWVIKVLLITHRLFRMSLWMLWRVRVILGSQVILGLSVFIELSLIVLILSVDVIVLLSCIPLVSFVLIEDSIIKTTAFIFLSLVVKWVVLRLSGSLRRRSVSYSCICSLITLIQSTILGSSTSIVVSMIAVLRLIRIDMMIIHGLIQPISATVLHVVEILALLSAVYCSL